MNIEVVTSFSNQGYELYGRRFLDSFQLHCDHRLVLYHESIPWHDRLHPQLEWRNLDHDEDRQAFIADHGADPSKVSDERYPNRQSIRFCHKVFALTDAALKSKAEWLIWMDADVCFHARADFGFLPSDASLVFLGRPHYRYTECGFVAYKIGNPLVMRMLADMRRYYTTGEIFTRPPDDHHDSRCFDICRSRSGIPVEQQKSLTDHAVGTHVWPQSPLQRFCDHRKGPARKRVAYGGIVP